MTYIRLDDDLPSNPKVAELTDAEFRRWIYLLCASSRHLSDGEITDGLLREIVPSAAVRRGLEAKGFVERNGRPGVVLHDYLEHQRSRADIERRGGAARKAARARWDRDEGPDSWHP